MYREGKVVGNFLLKYSPKLYQNELFQIELVNHITSERLLGKDFQAYQKGQGAENGSETLPGERAEDPPSVSEDDPEGTAPAVGDQGSGDSES
jgi:hypothetical protein